MLMLVKDSPKTDDGEVNEISAVQSNGKGSPAPLAKCGKKDAGRGRGTLEQILEGGRRLRK